MRFDRLCPEKKLESSPEEQRHLKALCYGGEDEEADARK